MYQALGPRRAACLARGIAELALRLARRFGTPDDVQSLVGVESMSLNQLRALGHALALDDSAAAFPVTLYYSVAREAEETSGSWFGWALIGLCHCSEDEARTRESIEAVRQIIASIFVSELPGLTADDL